MTMYPPLALCTDPERITGEVGGYDPELDLLLQLPEEVLVGGVLLGDDRRPIGFRVVDDGIHLVFLEGGLLEEGLQTGAGPPAAAGAPPGTGRGSRGYRSERRRCISGSQGRILYFSLRSVMRWPMAKKEDLPVQLVHRLGALRVKVPHLPEAFRDPS